MTRWLSEVGSRFWFMTAIVSTMALPAFASEFRGSDDWVMGRKFPNSPDEGQGPVTSYARSLTPARTRAGFNQLIPFVLRSPDQGEAGSCLYMSLTGAAEIFLARANPTLARTPDGPLDLSERYLMNRGALSDAMVDVKNWKTDSIFIFNSNHLARLNKDYRFTKGWYRVNGAGSYVPAAVQQSGASYDTAYNWINDLNEATGSPVELPNFSREVIFADPASNQWNIAVTPKDIVEQIKASIAKHQDPVQVIYNHMGYWHSVLIVGFNDAESTGNCAFTAQFVDNQKEQMKELKKKEDAATSASVKDSIHEKWLFAKSVLDKVNQSIKTAGGCKSKGVFYVRDSIYADKNGPMYDFDTSQTGDESLYTKPIVVHEYDWVTHFANHVIRLSAN